MTPKNVKLSKVLDYVRGITFKPDDVVDNFSEDSCVCMRTKNIQELIELDDLISVPHEFVKRDEQYIKKGDLLISSANSWNLVGKVVQVPELDFPSTAGGFISILRPKSEVIDPDYLFRFISSDETQHNIRYLGNQTTNISNLDRKRFLELDIPLPPLETQKKIAEILQRADTLRQQAKQMQTELDQLAQSIFIDMFGDPVTNPKKFDIKHFGESILIATNGLSRRKSLDEEGNDIVLRIRDVKADSIDISNPNKMNLSEKEQKRYAVEEGDILFIRVNGNKDYVGRCVVWDHSFAVYHNDHIIKIRLDKSRYEPRFMTYFFNSKPGKYLLNSEIKTAAGQFTISQKGLSSLNLILPELTVQQSFVEKLNQIEKEKASNSEAIQNLDDLFNSLMQKAFKGELVA